MFRKKLCPHCETGKYTYELDSRSPECPYLVCHDGRKCTKYKKAVEHKRQNIFERIVKRYLQKVKAGRP